jgi:hypothetical protein
MIGKSPGDGTYRKGMGTSSSLTKSEAPDKQAIWGLQQERWACHSSTGVAEGDPMRTDETEAREPSRLSLEVLDSAGIGAEYA